MQLDKEKLLLNGRVTQLGIPLQQRKTSGTKKSNPHSQPSPTQKSSAPVPLAKQPKPLPNEVVTYIVGEMKKNAASEAVKEIRALNDKAHKLTPGVIILPAAAAAAATLKGRAYSKWADLVNEGESWDHKGEIKKKYTAFQIIDFQAIGKAEKIQFFLDIWSNIHYGYVGLAAGFTQFELIEASNLQSRWHNGSPDPLSDVTSIKIGFRLYNGTLSVQELLKEIYAHSRELSGKPVK